MKIFHLSDLHIGKQLNGYSLKENQEAVLNQIVDYGLVHHPDAVLICGDIYDKTAPSGEPTPCSAIFWKLFPG
uniref:metallophosphoesterase family protein n=1 Tax=Clostridium sp. NkU-1 TaxID=1095009 RepID=UPI000A7FFE9E